jgi:hypothetical protein
MTIVELARAYADGLIRCWVGASTTQEREQVAAIIAELACPGATRSLVDQAFKAMRK